MTVKSLSFKLTIWYMVILVIIMTLGGVFLFERFKNGLMNDLEKKLSRIATTTYMVWWSKKGVTWQDALRKAEEQYKMCQPFIQVILMPHERRDKTRQETWEFLHSANIPGERFQLEKKLYLEARDRGRDNPLYLTVQAEPLSSYPLRTILFRGRSYAIIQVGLSLENSINAQRRLFFILILGGPLLLLLVGIGGSFIIRRALRPVQSVAQAAQKISAENLSMRIETGGRQDEIGQLVDTFNSMIARLEGSVEKIRQFSADVSHELRTPLTIIRGEVEVILRKDRDKKEYREILASILEETQQMETIIDDLLLLSRVRSVQKKMVLEDFPLQQTVQKVVDKFSPAAAWKDIRMEAGEMAALTFSGKRTLVERMVTNVIDNAIRYTRAGGAIKIALKKEARAARLTVVDSGIGIPPEAMPAIFDRFYVVDKSRSKESGGTGLGLSIVKWIADIHNIEIQVDSQPGQGTTFTFLFPLP